MQTLEAVDDLGPLLKLFLQVCDSALGGRKPIIDAVDGFELEDLAMVGPAVTEIVILLLLQHGLEDSLHEMGEHHGRRVPKATPSALDKRLWKLK